MRDEPAAIGHVSMIRIESHIVLALAPAMDAAA